MRFNDCLFFERERFPLFCPVILGFGIIAGVYFPFSYWGELFRFLSISTSLTVILYKYKRKLISLSILLFSLGVYVAQTGGILETKLLPNKQFIDKEYDKLDFTANVGFIEETHPTMKGMQRIVFNNIKMDDLDFIKTAKMTCSSRALTGIEPRDKVRVFCKLTPYKIAAIPNSFDQLQYNSLIKMDATGIVFNIKRLESNSSKDFMENFSYIRFYLTDAISRNISHPANGVAAALLTGDKSAIDPSIRDMFIKSGTAHILAISGLHMSILSGILFFIFLRFFLYLSLVFPSICPKKFAAIITIPSTFLYLALSGFSPSAIRAFIMTTVALMSITLGRGAISLRSVSFAAFLILLFDSASLFLVSFQLSFSAVLALISFYEKYSSTFSRLAFNTSSWKRPFIYLWSSVITTLVASLATLPISVATFNRLSLSSIFGNLIAIPMTSFIIAPLGIISLVFGYFTNFFTKCFGMAIDLLIMAISYVSSMPGSDIALRSPNNLTLTLMVIGGILLCLLKTRLKHIGSFIVAFSLITYIFEKNPDIVVPPGSEVVCFVKDGVFYSTSLQKGRNKVNSIQKNLGFSGAISKKEFTDFKLDKRTYNQGLFFWTKNGKIVEKKQIAKRRHPYCPAYYESLIVE